MLDTKSPLAPQSELQETKQTAHINGDQTKRPAPFTPASTLVDRYGRRITYLRMSVTDRCDLRCRYCMSEDMTFLNRRDVMSLDECLRVAKIFVGLGVNKIRITGGEPLVRKDIMWLLGQLRQINGLDQLVMTTNGSLLAEFAPQLKSIGINRLNVSLDTLRPERFTYITRIGKLEKTLAGIAAAQAAGIAIRLNVVMIRGFNDDELIDLVNFASRNQFNISFIEEMPLGEVHHRQSTFYATEEALAQLRPKFELHPTNENTGGPAKYWRMADHATRIGFISPHTHNFCDTCNRVRITAKGELYPCLGQNDAIELLPLLRRDGDDSDHSDGGDDDALRQALIDCMGIKPLGHDFIHQFERPQVVRFMSMTGG